MTNSPLAQLKDIHLPEKISLFPQTPAWYFLFFVVCLSLALSFNAYTRYRARQKPKRYALLALEAIKQNYERYKNNTRTLGEINSLLKRFCLNRYHRAEIAPLYGKSWRTFLGDEPWAHTLTTLTYQKSTGEDLSPLFDAIAQWIRECKHHV